MPALIKLPTVKDPQRYLGLYVYDFGTHASIGYTAAEIRVLRESEAYRGGTAYQIYGVTDSGVYELRGVVDERLAAREAICFLRKDGTAARRDYDALRHAAEGSPVPCIVQMQLANVWDFEPAHVTALLYAVSASAALSGWLGRCGFDGGDRVIGGTDVHDAFIGADAVRIDSCQLAALLDYRDRPPEEVLKAVSEPVQR